MRESKRKLSEVYMAMPSMTLGGGEEVGTGELWAGVGVAGWAYGEKCEQGLG